MFKGSMVVALAICIYLFSSSFHVAGDSSPGSKYNTTASVLMHINYIITDHFFSTAAGEVTLSVPHFQASNYDVGLHREVHLVTSTDNIRGPPYS